MKITFDVNELWEKFSCHDDHGIVRMDKDDFYEAVKFLVKEVAELDTENCETVIVYRGKEEAV